MDAWMREAGARVDGHRGVVRGARSGARASCSCGRLRTASLPVESACLALVQHLQTEVRAGAKVLREEDGDGLSGVREPRRPLPPSHGGSAALDTA